MNKWTWDGWIIIVVKAGQPLKTSCVCSGSLFGNHDEVAWMWNIEHTRCFKRAHPSLRIASDQNLGLGLIGGVISDDEGWSENFWSPYGQSFVWERVILSTVFLYIFFCIQFLLSWIFVHVFDRFLYTFPSRSRILYRKWLRYVVAFHLHIYFKMS